MLFDRGGSGSGRRGNFLLALTTSGGREQILLAEVPGPAIDGSHRSGFFRVGILLLDHGENIFRRLLSAVLVVIEDDIIDTGHLAHRLGNRLGGYGLRGRRGRFGRGRSVTGRGDIFGGRVGVHRDGHFPHGSFQRDGGGIRVIVRTRSGIRIFGLRGGFGGLVVVLGRVGLVGLMALFHDGMCFGFGEVVRMLVHLNYKYYTGFLETPHVKKFWKKISLSVRQYEYRQSAFFHFLPCR
jgi:hypothetical protein